MTITVTITVTSHRDIAHDLLDSRTGAHQPASVRVPRGHPVAQAREGVVGVVRQMDARLGDENVVVGGAAR